MSRWNTGLAPENVVLDTKIDDKDGCRNECKLIRKRNLWWSEDGAIYMYYRPTHWAYPEENENVA